MACRTVLKDVEEVIVSNFIFCLFIDWRRQGHEHEHWFPAKWSDVPPNGTAPQHVQRSRTRRLFYERAHNNRLQPRVSHELRPEHVWAPDGCDGYGWPTTSGSLESRRWWRRRFRWWLAGRKTLHGTYEHGTQIPKRSVSPFCQIWKLRPGKQLSFLAYELIFVNIFTLGFTPLFGWIFEVCPKASFSNPHDSSCVEELYIFNI